MRRESWQAQDGGAVLRTPLRGKSWGVRGTHAAPSLQHTAVFHKKTALHAHAARPRALGHTSPAALDTEALQHVVRASKKLRKGGNPPACVLLHGKSYRDGSIDDHVTAGRVGVLEIKNTIRLQPRRLCCCPGLLSGLLVVKIEVAVQAALGSKQTPGTETSRRACQPS